MDKMLLYLMELNVEMMWYLIPFQSFLSQLKTPDTCTWERHASRPAKHTYKKNVWNAQPGRAPILKVHLISPRRRLGMTILFPGVSMNDLLMHVPDSQPSGSRLVWASRLNLDKRWSIAWKWKIAMRKAEGAKANRCQCSCFEHLVVDGFVWRRIMDCTVADASPRW
jgi:hypothetical protein